MTAITPAPALTDAQRITVASDLRNALADETLSGYVLALQKRLGAHIFEDEFRGPPGAPPTKPCRSRARRKNKARSHGCDADARQFRRAL